MIDLFMGFNHLIGSSISTPREESQESATQKKSVTKTMCWFDENVELAAQVARFGHGPLATAYIDE